jgi:hypothetical protein
MSITATSISAQELRRPRLLALSRDPRTEQARQVMLDLDSTVFPLLPAMAMHSGGERINYDDCMSWMGLADLCAGDSADERLQMMLSLFAKAWEPETMRAVGAFPGAVETARALVEHGVRIYVVTHRPEALYEATAAYLAEIDLPYYELAVHPKVDKVAYCMARGIGIAVDDHPDFIPAAHEAGLHVEALRFNYNVDELASIGSEGAEDWTVLSGRVLDAVQARAVAAAAVRSAAAGAAPCR